MKKIFFLLLLCIGSFTIKAQSSNGNSKPALAADRVMIIDKKDRKSVV